MRSTILKIDDEKRALIERLSNQGATLSIYFDEEADGSFPINQVRAGLADIEPPYDNDVLERWWYYGNWQAVTPPAHAFEPIDTFRAEPAQVEEQMLNHGISLIIDSFHDDIEWHVIERD